MYNISKQRILAGLAVAVTQVVFGLQGNASTPSFGWASGSGGNSFDNGNSVAVDNAGNTYVAGSFQSTTATFGSFTLNNSDLFEFPDIFVAKLNPQGVVLWAKQAGSPFDDIATSIGVDAAGNAYVAGYFTGIANFGGISLTNSGSGGNIFLTKYDTAGNVVWAKKVTAANDCSATGIAVTPNGTSYITGYFYDSISFDSLPLVSSGSKDVFIAKFNSSGNAIWVKSAGGTSDDEPKGIAVDDAGNCYVTGYYISTSALFGATVLTNNIDSAEVFVAKYTSSGNFSWARQSKGSLFEIANSIAADSDGNCYVTGTFWDSVQFGPLSLTNTNDQGDIFVVKYNTSGNPLWAKSAKGDGDDTGFGIAADMAGFSYITGTFKGAAVDFGGNTITNNGFFTGDIFVAKLDPSGNNLWIKSVGSAEEEASNGIAIDKDGNGYISGFSYATISFDGDTVSNNGNSDVFVARFDAPPFVYEMTRPSATEMSFTYPYLPVTAGMESISALGTSTWEPVTNADVLSGEHRTVTVSTTNGSRFFRLSKSLPE